MLLSKFQQNIFSRFRIMIVLSFLLIYQLRHDTVYIRAKNRNGLYFLRGLKTVLFSQFFLCLFFFQVIIRGSHIIVSRLSIDVDVQILTNPSLNTEQSSKARYQVLLIKLGMIKQIFNRVSKIIWDCIGFALLYSMIGPQNWRHSLDQSDTKLIPITTWSSHAFSRASAGLFGWFYSAFSLALWTYSFPLIGRRDKNNQRWRG